MSRISWAASVQDRRQEAIVATIEALAAWVDKAESPLSAPFSSAG
jgi:hypothetical protein